MKVCCEKCEKGVKKNDLLDTYVGGQVLIIKRGLFYSSIVLCDECYKKFLKFLEDKEEAEQALKQIGE